jgi:hypothetical protein
MDVLRTAQVACSNDKMGKSFPRSQLVDQSKRYIMAETILQSPRKNTRRITNITCYDDMCSSGGKRKLFEISWTTALGYHHYTPKIPINQNVTIQRGLRYHLSSSSSRWSPRARSHQSVSLHSILDIGGTSLLASEPWEKMHKVSCTECNIISINLPHPSNKIQNKLVFPSLRHSQSSLFIYSIMVFFQRQSFPTPRAFAVLSTKSTSQKSKLKTKRTTPRLPNETTNKTKHKNSKNNIHNGTNLVFGYCAPGGIYPAVCFTAQFSRKSREIRVI